jgi:hypothetical protein
MWQDNFTFYYYYYYYYYEDVANICNTAMKNNIVLLRVEGTLFTAGINLRVP